MNGAIYEKVAKKCIYDKDDSLDDVEVNSIICRSDYEKVGLDESIDIQAPLKAALGSLTDVLDQNDIKLGPNFLGIIFHSQIPNTFLLEPSDEVYRKRFDEMEKAEITLKTLADIHDSWVAINHEKFFSPNYSCRQFAFLPAKLVGFNELMRGYLFIEDTLAVLGLKTGVYTLQKCHMKMWQNYKRQYDIKNIDALANHLASLEKDDLAPVIWEELRNPDTARRVASQIVLANDVPLVW